MTYIPLRKDLTEGTETCEFCKRPLNSLTAYILRDIKNSRDIYAGPSCAQKKIATDSNIRQIPDFTKFTQPAKRDEKESPRHSVNDGNRTREIDLIDDDKKYKKAIEYIELRENKLKENFNTSYSILAEYYIEYLTNNKIDKKSVEHILNIENKAQNQLKLDNLQKCYNYSFWINVGINRLDSDASKFLGSVLKYLEKNLKISEKQKVGVNNWLKKLKHIPQIK